MHLRILLLLLITCLLTRTSSAQPLADWVVTGIDATDRDDHGKDVTADPSGNIIQVGNFKSLALHLEDTILYQSPLLYVGHEFADLFVAKYTAAGQLIWAFKSSGTLSEFGNGVDTDADGNIFVAGSFNGDTAEFGNIRFVEPDNFNYKSFLLKMAPDGTLLWAKKLLGTMGPNYINETPIFSGSEGWVLNDLGIMAKSIKVDSEGHVLVGYQYRIDTVQVGGTTHLSGSPMGIYGNDMLFVKYDNEGTPLWSTQVTGTDFEALGRIDVDGQGSLVATGYSNSLVMSAGPIDVTVPETYGDVAVVKIDASGSVLWAKRFGGRSGTDMGRSIATDADGNIYVCGGFLGDTLQFGNFPVLNDNQSTGTPSMDLFLAKLGPDGGPQWAVGATAYAGVKNAKGVATDADGCVYLTGDFTFDATFGGITAENYYPYPEISYPADDIFIVKYNATGDVVWARSAGGGGYDNASNITIGGDGSVLFTGSYRTNGAGFIVDGVTYGSTDFREMYLVSLEPTNCTAFIGIADGIADASGITVYPNPTEGRLVIDSPLPVEGFTVLDVSGRVVQHVAGIRTFTVQVDLGALPSGTYTLRVAQSGSTEPGHRRVVKL